MTFGTGDHTPLGEDEAVAALEWALRLGLSLEERVERLERLVDELGDRLTAQQRNGGRRYPRPSPDWEPPRPVRDRRPRATP